MHRCAEEAGEGVLSHLSRTMTKQMWCYWIVTIFPGKTA